MNYLVIIVVLSVVLFPAAGVRAVSGVQPEPIVFKRNGGWCWFQDPRVIVDDEKIILASVAGKTAQDCDAGDVEITSYDIASGKRQTFKLAPQFQCDDHNVPSILRLGDGRYLAVYQSHGARGLGDAYGPADVGARRMRYRITVRPGDITEWTPEQSIDVGAGISYANLYRLSAENGRIYNFHRGIGFNPNYMISEDSGASFRYSGRLMSWQHPEGTRGGGRPYPRYASNDVDTIHFITTEDHPHHYPNSIYHGYLRAGKLHRSDGTVVGALSTTEQTDIRPADFTRVFAGDSKNVAWTCDIELDAQGRPYIAFSVQRGAIHPDAPPEHDHRYYYGRWDGSQWQVHEIAYAGTNLYPRERHYTGLVALDPNDPDTLFISTNADPVTGAPLISAADGARRWEIFQGRTTDGGKTWHGSRLPATRRRTTSVQSFRRGWASAARFCGCAGRIRHTRITTWTSLESFRGADALQRPHPDRPINPIHAGAEGQSHRPDAE